MTRKLLDKESVTEVLDILGRRYPDARCALDHDNVFELLVAVSLSAQTTDKSVNKVTPELFAKWPDAASLAAANPVDVAEVIRSIGMYRRKAENLVNMAAILDNDYAGLPPRDMDGLMSLPGVGRKTANVVLSVGFGEQHIAVDTHVFRVSNRIGLCAEKTPEKTEIALMRRIEEQRRTEAHHVLIWHGRTICTARKPACEECPIESTCLKKF